MGLSDGRFSSAATSMVSSCLRGAAERRVRCGVTQRFIMVEGAIPPHRHPQTPGGAVLFFLYTA